MKDQFIKSIELLIIEVSNYLNGLSLPLDLSPSWSLSIELHSKSQQKKVLFWFSVCAIVARNISTLQAMSSSYQFNCFNFRLQIVKSLAIVQRVHRSNLINNYGSILIVCWKQKISIHFSIFSKSFFPFFFCFWTNFDNREII